MSEEAAREKLASLEKNLSPDQIHLAQKRASEIEKDIEAKIAAKQAGK